MKRFLVASAFLTIATTAYADDAGKAAAGHPAYSMYDVLERIRQDVGYYEVQAASWRGDITPKIDDPAFEVPSVDDSPKEKPPQGKNRVVKATQRVCPTSNYDIDVSNVEVMLVTSTIDSETGGLGLEVPLFGGGDGSSGGGRTQNETIVLHRSVPYDIVALKKYSASEDYNILSKGHREVKAADNGPDEKDATSGVFPISDTLIALRKSLVRAAEKLPCFDQQNDESARDSVTLEFQVQHSINAKIGFTFRVITAQADHKKEDGVVNKITVKFAPHPKPATKSVTVADNTSGN